MVDVQLGEHAAALAQPVDELLERPALVLAVVGPEVAVLRLTGVVEVHDAEQILEAALEREAVAFHVEEHVAGRRFGQRREPAVAPAVAVRHRDRIGFLGLEQLEERRVDALASHLELGLLAEPLEHWLLDAADGSVGRQRRERAAGGHARVDELAGVVTSHPRHEREMIVGAAAFDADVVPAADAAVIHGIGVGDRDVGRDERLAARLQRPVVRGRVASRWECCSPSPVSTWMCSGARPWRRSTCSE